MSYLWHCLLSQFWDLLQVVLNLHSVLPLQRVEHLRGHLHHTEAVLKSCVHRPGVNEVLHRKLAYVTEPLKYFVVNQLTFVLRIPDEPMHRTTYPQLLGTAPLF